jgi:hypothetical protein
MGWCSGWWLTSLAATAAAFIWRLAPDAPIIYKYGSQPTEKMRREIQNPQVFHQHVSLSPERCTFFLGYAMVFSAEKAEVGLNPKRNRSYTQFLFQPIRLTSLILFQKIIYSLSTLMINCPLQLSK